MLDLLLSRYSDINFILDLSVDDGVRLINKAFEERNNERMYQRWIMGYDKELTFADFKNKLTVQKIDETLTEDEIMEDVEAILNQFRR